MAEAVRTSKVVPCVSVCVRVCVSVNACLQVCVRVDFAQLTVAEHSRGLALRRHIVFPQHNFTTF